MLLKHPVDGRAAVSLIEPKTFQNHLAGWKKHICGPDLAPGPDVWHPWYKTITVKSLKEWVCVCFFNSLTNDAAFGSTYIPRTDVFFLLCREWGSETDKESEARHLVQRWLFQRCTCKPSRSPAGSSVKLCSARHWALRHTLSWRVTVWTSVSVSNQHSSCPAMVLAHTHTSTRAQTHTHTQGSS